MTLQSIAREAPLSRVAVPGDPGRTGSDAGTPGRFTVSREVGAALAARAAGHPVGTGLRTPDPAGEPVGAPLVALAPARRIRLELLVVADRLVAEFADRWTPGGVLRCVADCRADLRGSGLTAGLPEAVDRLARQRLTERAAVESDGAGSGAAPRTT